MTILSRLAAFFALLGAPAAAQEVTLRLHHFLPPQSTVPARILDVWADRVEDASDGRIAIRRFPAMQLGGGPSDLIDQAQSGVADIVWTVVGYTPGRFPSTEVFELPFFVTDARAAAHAYWTMAEEGIADEFEGLHLLGTWVHGPGVIHAARPVRAPEDLRGLKLRGGSRLVAQTLDALGAEAIGMPAPAIPESLSRGVIDGATLPWEVTPSLRVAELVPHHTEFEGAYLYTLAFVLAMNEGAYEALPEDLRAIIDAESGAGFSVFAAGVQADADAPARDLALDLGNEIDAVPAAEVEAAWRPLVAPVTEGWLADMEARGLDGRALMDRAAELMASFEGDGDEAAD